MVRHDSVRGRSRADLLRRGIIGGLIGGMAMAMLIMIVTAARGMGFLKPLYLIAALFHQPWAMVSGVQIGPLLIGAMLHMVNAVIFGLIFVLVAEAIARGNRIGSSLGVAAGMAWGLVLLVVNQALILPLVDPAMATATNGMMAWWVVSHLMYGLVLGVVMMVPLSAHSPVVAGSAARRAML